MEIQFAKWGNSLAVRIPAKVAEALGITAGTVADLELKRDRLLISPRRERYSLEELVAGITEHNLHGEIQTGNAEGAEVVD